MCVTKAQFNYTLTQRGTRVKLAGTWVKLELGDTITMVELKGRENERNSHQDRSPIQLCLNTMRNSHEDWNLCKLELASSLELVDTITMVELRRERENKRNSHQDWSPIQLCLRTKRNVTPYQTKYYA